MLYPFNLKDRAIHHLHIPAVPNHLPPGQSVHRRLIEKLGERLKRTCIKFSAVYA